MIFGNGTFALNIVLLVVAIAIFSYLLVRRLKKRRGNRGSQQSYRTLLIAMIVLCSVLLVYMLFQHYRISKWIRKNV